MAVQSRLENIGISKRNDLVQKNDYVDEDIVSGKEYGENHPDAMSDGDPLGKGSGQSMGFSVANPNSFYITNTGVRVQQMDYSTLVTKETPAQTVGGEYDRNGRSGLSHSGRNTLMTMNRYNEANEYGEQSVDTSANILQGQYKVQ